MAKRIIIGRIIGAHGIKGELRLHSYTENPRDILNYGELTDESAELSFNFVLVRDGGAARGSRGKNSLLIVREVSVNTRDAAESLKGQALYVSSSALPATKDDEYYLRDIVGLQVCQEGEQIGVVIAMHDYGAGLIVEIKPNNGSSFMLPFKHPYVGQIDLTAGVINVSIPLDWIEE